MVTNASNYGSSSKGAFGRTGVFDWLVQRKSAVLMGLYLIFVLYYFVVNAPMSYDNWRALFSPFYLKVLHIAVLFSIISHAWVGLWTIATDYLACFTARSLFLLVCKTLLFSYLVWGVYIIYLV